MENLQPILEILITFLSKRELAFLERDRVTPVKKEKSETVNRKEQKKLEAEVRQQKHKATKDLAKEISFWEEKIVSYESLVKDLENKLADPNIYSDGDIAKEITS